MRDDDDAAVSAEEAKRRFSNVLDRAAKGKERVVVTRRGRPVAALVPMRDVKALERLEDELDLADARRALAEWRRGGCKTAPLDAVLKKHGIKR